MGPGNRPIRNGAYAGPVTDGKHDVTVNNPPLARRRASAGNWPPSIAAASASGRTPSARRMTTDTGCSASGGYRKVAAGRFCLNPARVRSFLLFLIVTGPNEKLVVGDVNR